MGTAIEHPVSDQIKTSFVITDIRGILWSRDRCRHVTLKGQGHDPICLVPIIVKMAGDSDLVTMDCL